MLRPLEVKLAYLMSSVTGIDKKRPMSRALPLALAVALGISGIVQSAALAQQGQYPPQYQQGPGQPVPGMAQPVGYPQGYPPQGQGQFQQQLGGNQGGQPSAERAQALASWFQNYDEVRRKAQMTPAERTKADGLMSKAISMFIPGEEKVQAQKLLTSLVGKYNQAVEDMKRLPLYPETEKLHRGYYQYFSTARQLFSDYLTVQQNPLSTDSAGNPIAGTLFARKQSLEGLDQTNKTLDGQLRAQYGIPAYRYQ